MENLEIDRQARERAEGWIDDLDAALGEASSFEHGLEGLVGDGLGRAVVLSVITHTDAAREQLGSLRQAVRDMDPEFRREVAAA